MHHKTLAAGTWSELSFAEQMANIGSEVERTLKWRKKNQPKFATKAFERATELFNLTINAHLANDNKLNELLRLRECWFDDIYFSNSYQSTDEKWQKYFRNFNYLARL